MSSSRANRVTHFGSPYVRPDSFERQIAVNVLSGSGRCNFSTHLVVGQSNASDFGAVVREKWAPNVVGELLTALFCNPRSAPVA